VSACLSSACRKTKHHPLIFLRKRNANLMWCGYGQRTVQLSAYFQRLQAVHPRKTDTFVVNLKFSVQRSSYWTNEWTDYVPNFLLPFTPKSLYSWCILKNRNVRTHVILIYGVSAVCVFKS
jgi:hypothetical protein